MSGSGARESSLFRAGGGHRPHRVEAAEIRPDLRGNARGQAPFAVALKGHSKPEVSNIGAPKRRMKHKSPNENCPDQHEFAKPHQVYR